MAQIVELPGSGEMGCEGGEQLLECSAEELCGCGIL